MVINLFIDIIRLFTARLRLLSKSHSKNQLKILIQLLQLTADSQGSSEQFYSLLQAHQDLFNHNCPTLLNNWVKSRLLELGSEKARNLAINIVTFSNLIQRCPLGLQKIHLEVAITGYNLALEVLTRDAFPRYHADILYHLGLIYKHQNLLDLGYKSFREAIDIIEFMVVETVEKDDIQWQKLYQEMVDTCLELKLYNQAIEYIERSKNRSLLELLVLQDLSLKMNSEVDNQGKLRQIREEIKQENQRLLVERKKLDKNIYHQSVSQLSITDNTRNLFSQNLDYARINQLRQIYRDNHAEQPIKYKEIQHLLTENTAIIELYILPDYFCLFIITHQQGEPIKWKSSKQDLRQLQNWYTRHIQLYNQDKQRWKNNLAESLQGLAEIIHIDEIISLIPNYIQQLIFIPHLLLHLLPLHALPLQNGDYIIDRFSQGVGYVPNCQLLKIAQQKFQQQQKTNNTNSDNNFFAIQNPTEDLAYTDVEVEAIASIFIGNYSVLAKKEATKIALTKSPYKKKIYNVKWLHFSCHGYFDFQCPLQSGLLLANSFLKVIPSHADPSRYVSVKSGKIDLERCLTLSDILTWKLPNCRLVTLSACETGLTDFRDRNKEYIGFPSGFIYAGSPNVVGSLWSVDDFSTALLMIRFYENLQLNHHQSSGVCGIYLALNEAQKWLRTRTKAELLKFILIKFPDVHHRIQVRVFLKTYPDDSQPFASPYFWAGFCPFGSYQ